MTKLTRGRFSRVSKHACPAAQFFTPHKKVHEKEDLRTAYTTGLPNTLGEEICTRLDLQDLACSCASAVPRPSGDCAGLPEISPVSKDSIAPSTSVRPYPHLIGIELGPPRNRLEGRSRLSAGPAGKGSGLSSRGALFAPKSGFTGRVGETQFGTRW